MRPRTSRLGRLPSKIGMLEQRTALPAPKTADPIYKDSRYLEFRSVVMRRAGYRCEVIEDGGRCWRRAPEYRMYADHIVELKDGGDPFNPANGMCRCASHHTQKTIEERDKRFAAPVSQA